MSVVKKVTSQDRCAKHAYLKLLLRLTKSGIASLAGLIVLVGCSSPTSDDAHHSTPATSVLARNADATKAPELPAAKSRLRLISQDQYNNTLASIFGPDVVPDVKLTPFERTEGLLALGAAYDGFTTDSLEKFQAIATAVSSRVVSPERRDFFISCKPSDPKRADDACAVKFLGRYGERLFRRPLRSGELTEAVAKAAEGTESTGDFYKGLSLAFERLLMSPKTLLIEDIVEADPKNRGQKRINAFSLASRLSFFLWNMAPDDVLLKAAADGELYKPEGLAHVVDAMLASPKLEIGMRAFFDDMLGLSEFDILAKDATIYPSFTGKVAVEAREQTLRTIVDLLLTRKGDYRDLFTTRDTFIAPSIAGLYQQPAIKSWAAYTIPQNSPRAGIVMQAGFLALHSHPGRSSATLRGKALRELLLCQPVPRPPANVDFSVFEKPNPNLRTARERLMAHQANPVCAGCHRITDPIGLAFEHFDGAGQYRDTEKGAAIDVSGEFDGKKFKSADEFAQVLHDSPAIPACLVKRVYSYATGVRLDPAQGSQIEYLNSQFAREGYRLPSLLRMIALSPAFLKVDKESDTRNASVKTATIQ